MGGETITGLLFIQPLYQLAYNILIVFYRLLGNDLGLAIIAFTLVLRAVTLPFTFKQIKYAKKSKEFQVKYKELQAKHKGDKDKMAQELTKLQAEYLPSQLGGCLPLLLQIVFFFQIFYVVKNAVEVGTVSFNRINYSFIPEFAKNQVFDINFFGINLGKSASQIGFDNIEKVLPYLILVGLVGITQFIASKVSMQLSGQDLAPKPKTKVDPKTGKDTTEEEEYSFADAMQQSSRQMLYILPVMTMFFAVNFPAGLALYWTVSSGFSVFQQLIIKKDEVKATINRLRGKEVITAPEATNKENQKQVIAADSLVVNDSNSPASRQIKKKKDKKKKRKKKR